ncbi:MAG: hypothetical protein GY711_24110, partial [bacterium]|nr:hypothetical protein [bacterium]
SVDEIADMLVDPVPDVRTAAIKVMGELDLSIDRNLGRILLTDAVEVVRIEAVRYFAERREPRVLPEVMRLLPSGTQALQTEIVGYLRAVAAKDFDALREMLGDGELGAEAMASLVEIAAFCGGTKAVRFIAESTKHEDSQLRATAFGALDAVDGRRFASLVKKGLADPVEDVRIAVLTSLARRPQAASYERAVELAEDPDENVRLVLALSLGAAGMTQHAPQLIRLLDDGSTRVVAAAMTSLAALDDHSLQDDIYLRVDLREIRKAITEIQRDRRCEALIASMRERAA